MKKKALVAAVLAATTLSATPAFAASNPFKDLPADHWAYDAVNMLAKDGVIEGYGDGTFGGDNLMNRYEMAEIVAKAAEKYGNVSMKDKGAIKKLEREFKNELQDMDARLTAVESDVADLKKGMSSFKWYGDMRLRYVQNKDNKMTSPQASGANQRGKERVLEKRMRLGIWGEPAKNLSVDARIKYEDETGKHKGAYWDEATPDNANFNDWDNSYNNQKTFRLDKASLIWNNAGTRWAIGRNEVSIGQGGIWWENPIDGVTVTHQFGPKLSVMAGYGDLGAEGWHDTTMWAYFTGIKYQASPATQITFGSMHTNSTLSTETQEDKVDIATSYVLSDATKGLVDTTGKKYTNADNTIWTDTSTGTTYLYDASDNWTKHEVDMAASVANGAIKQEITATPKTVTTWNKRDYKLNQFSIGFNSQLSPKWNLLAEGLYNNIGCKNTEWNHKGEDLDKKGFWARLTYGKVQWWKGGTWAVHADYYALGNASIDSAKWGHRLDIAGGNSAFTSVDNRWGNGVRGWGIGVSYMLANNTNLDLSYYKLKPFDKNANYYTFDNYDDVALAALTYSF